jgi:hypothetical protein
VETHVQQLTQSANNSIQNLAQRYGVSADAVTTLLFAVAAGNGSMAQFYHPELGGGGQWMRGGMTMVGDMFNHGLQATVANLCSELSGLLSSTQVFVPTPPSINGNYGGNWWPGDLGSPSSSGGKNDSRYAYFPSTQRLAIDRAGQVSVYNTLDHHIGGVQQQQGGYAGSLSFTSQFGTFTVDSLPLVSPAPAPTPQQSYQQPEPVQYQQPAPYQQSAPAWSPAPPMASGNPQNQSDVLATLERLGELQQKGVLSDEEFRAKKAELLSRL